jgi:hypothetical protein
MTTFDDRERGEETKFKHELELGFKIRNRRNKMFGLWVAQDLLGLSSDAAAAYAKEVVMADFDLPGDADMMDKVRADLGRAGKTVSDHQLDKHLKQLEVEARKQVMSE